MFQVIQVTKKPKWKCKICNSQQSVLSVFAISASAADIRGVVSRLNLEQGLAREAAPLRRAQFEDAPDPEVEEVLGASHDDQVADDHGQERFDTYLEPGNCPPPPKRGRWSDYIDDEHNEDHALQDDDVDVQVRLWLTRRAVQNVE
eukprot:TRINITY_DN7557_c1_g2_i1.p2 TRINITY_DN7557_c1_g2~~TRINITY_DN7557_c1_g2_i1.p2  ORF type:complete len:158 (+),score=10.86 TRINITY_DN7557_c1_g2_i1:37-474(+)